MEANISQSVPRSEPQGPVPNRPKLSISQNDVRQGDGATAAVERFAAILQDADQKPTQKFTKLSDSTYKAEPAKEKSVDDKDDKNDVTDNPMAENHSPQAENQLLKNMLAMMSKQVQIIMLPPIESKQWVASPVQAVQTTVDQVVAYVEKVDKSAYHFKMQGQALEIRVDRKNGDMHITIYAPKELSKELAENRYQLSDYLKTKLNSNDVVVDFALLPESTFFQQQGQQNSQQDQPSSEEEESTDETEKI